MLPGVSMRCDTAVRATRTTSIKLWTVAAVGLFAVALCPVTARADSDGDVNVGGEHILTVRFASNGFSVKDRAEAITDRLTRILSDSHIRAADIVVVPSGKDAVIKVKDRLLVTVDRQTAHFNMTTPMALGESWAKHLRIVLPRVNARPNPNEEKGAGK
jgi:hypothetical protein